MAVKTSDLIQFKRGTSESLNELIKTRAGIDGCFYLTVDDDDINSADRSNSTSSRLYVGRATGDIVPVNQGIYTVATVDNLNSDVNGGKLQPGDFAYVTNGNIFAYFNGKNWIQLNATKDTTNSSLEITQTGASDGSVNVTVKVTDSAGNDVSDSFKIAGANGTKVSVAGDTITVTGDQYRLNSNFPTDDTAKITLSSDTKSDAGSVTIKSGSRVKVAKDTDGALKLEGTDFAVSGVSVTSSGDGFKVAVTQNSGNSVTSTAINPKIAYGETGSEQVGFTDGKATLQVYSKADIDNKLKVLDGMTYRGTIGAGGTAAEDLSLLANVHNGDTYKVAANMTLPAQNSKSGEEISLRAGDLLIANGTEGKNGILTAPYTFDYIPSGDDPDTTYSVQMENHGVTLNPSTGTGNIGGIKLAAGDLVTLTDSQDADGKVKTVAIAHSDVATTETAQTAGTQSNAKAYKFKAIVGLTTNKGHVTNYQTKEITVVDTNTTLTNMAYAATAVNNIATVKATVNAAGGDGTTQSITSAFTLGSDNLNVTASGTGVKANLI